MKYFRFKTFRTSYYFPDTGAHSKYLYDIYHPYGSALVKLYWKMFISLRWVRFLSTVNEKDLDFPYCSIKRLCPPDAIISFNLGTPGDEQKISMLGYIPEKNQSFFAKYSVKEKAKALSRNEIHVLKQLEKTNLSPILLSEYDNGKEVFFSTTRVCGKPYSTFNMKKGLLDILISLGEINKKKNPTDGLITSLSHGDFCPWNMLQDGNDIKLIDWEMATNRPLGYDLYMFIIHSRLVMGANEAEIIKSLQDNANIIKKYFNAFGITSTRNYLMAYLDIRLKEEHEKKHIQMEETYRRIRLSI